jgi:ClpP class serine protease
MWLLKAETAAQMALAVKEGLCPTAEQRAEFVARRTAALSEDGGAPNPRVLTVAGDNADVFVDGLLTAEPDLFAMLFGGGNTTYSELLSAINRIENDPAIKKATFRINSAGGQMAGLYPVLLALDTMQTKRSVVAQQACSAAYAIAAVIGQIEATDPSAEFGSIGVATKLAVDDGVVHIASSAAPKKRPDVRTEEGKAVVREYLDNVHELFADAVAKGRGVDSKTVNTTFGRGQTFLAKEAKAVGMIDRIAKLALRPAAGSTSRAVRAQHLGVSTEERRMDLADLKANHPELYAAVLEEKQAAAPVTGASPSVPVISQLPTVERKMDLNTFRTQHAELFAAAVAEGESNERKRVKAHLNLGEKCGDMSIAVSAIRNGDDFNNPEVQSLYMGAAMNRSDRATRQTDSDAAGKALDKAVVEGEHDMGDQVADIVERQLGKKKVG